MLKLKKCMWWMMKLVKCKLKRYKRKLDKEMHLELKLSYHHRRHQRDGS
jgi:hypothetical protein